MIRGAVFDMDGLMFDTENLTYKLQRGILSGYGVDYTLPQYKQTIGKRTADLEGFFKNLCGADFSYGVFRGQCREAFVEYTDKHGVPIKPGLFELLDFFKGNGVKIALSTSTTRGSAERLLRISNTLPYFDELVCADDVSRGKPHPEPFLKAAEKLALPAKDCLALEDSLNGICSAYAAGLVPVMVPDLIPPSEEIRGMCFKICDNLSEVVEILNSSEY